MPRVKRWGVGEAGPERSPAAIRAASPVARRGEFDAAYVHALVSFSRFLGGFPRNRGNLT